MSKFVNTFPPPPDYFALFSEEDFQPAPPAVVELKNNEIFGGSMLLPESDQDHYNPDRDYRQELKRCLKEYMLEGLNFVTDENPKQSFDKGAIAIETKSTQLYDILREYRPHEARERLSIKMKEQVAELQELRDSLARTLDEATALYHQDCDQLETNESNAVVDIEVITVKEGGCKVFSVGSFSTSCSKEALGVFSKKELSVIQEPSDDKILREVSSPVSFNSSLLLFMLEYLLPTMYKENGIGIASVQVSLPIRAFIVDIPYVTHVDGVEVDQRNNDPRYIRKATTAGKVVKVIETKPVYEVVNGELNVHHISTEKIVGSSSDSQNNKFDDVVAITRKPIFVINPTVEYLSPEMIVMEEGCLSVPHEYILQTFGPNTRVERPNGLRMKYTNEKGEIEYLSVDGNNGEHEKWMVRCVLHEYDHLHGVLFTDKLYEGD